MNISKELVIILWEILATDIPKAGDQFIKRINWSHPHTVKGKTISGAPIFHNGANKSGKAGYKNK